MVLVFSEEPVLVRAPFQQVFVEHAVVLEALDADLSAA